MFIKKLFKLPLLVCSMSALKISLYRLFFLEVITRQENNTQEIPSSYYDGLCLAVLPPCSRRDFESACSPLTFIWDTLSEYVECKIPSCFFYVTSDSYHYLRWLLFLRCRDPCNKKREKRDHLRLYLLLQWYV